MTFFELHDQAGAIRGCYAEVQRWIDETGIAGLRRRMDEAETIFRRIGITFAVYGEGGDPERLIPFDLLPRVFSRLEWERLDRGIRQRAQAVQSAIFKTGKIAAERLVIAAPKAASPSARGETRANLSLD